MGRVWSCDRNGRVKTFRKKMLNFVSVVLSLKHLAGKVQEERGRILPKGADMGPQHRNRSLVWKTLGRFQEDGNT